jgi:hypothetical protein
VRLTRRQVLAAMAALPAAGAVGAGTLAFRWWDRSPMEGLRSLSSDEHAFVQAMAEAWMPPGGEPALSGAEARLGDFLDGVASAMPAGGAREFKLLLQVLDDLPWPTHGGPFRSLSLESRSAVLHSWLHHDQWLLRNAAVAVLVLIAEGYTLHPDVAPILRPHFRCGFGP